MAATRLRRTFHYPTEEEDEDAVEEGMDEQDQEALLANLSTKDITSTSLYTKLLLILPLAPVCLYIPKLLSPSTIIPSLAAIATLLASAYALYFLPLPPVKVNVIHASEVGPSDSSAKSICATDRKSYALDTPTKSENSVSNHELPPVPYVSDDIAALLAKYIIPANAALCILLALVEVWQGRSWSEGMMIGGGYVPAFVLAVVLWARRELRVVDLGALEKLKHEMKGT